MEPEGSLTHLQVPASRPYPKPDQSSPSPPSHVLKNHLIPGTTSHVSSIPLVVPKYQSRLYVSWLCQFLRWGVVGISPNPQAGGPPFVGFPRLLIQCIHSYPSYWRLFLHQQPEDAPCRGDRDPFIMGLLLQGHYFMWPVSFVTFCRSCVRIGRRPCTRDLLYCWAERARMLCWC